jgi:hypothetical protein
MACQQRDEIRNPTIDLLRAASGRLASLRHLAVGAAPDGGSGGRQHASAFASLSCIATGLTSRLAAGSYADGV